MAEKLFNEIMGLLEEQPLLEMQDNKKEYIIEGIYKYALEFNGCIAQGNRRVKIIVQKNYPNSIPKFFMFDYPADMEHIYHDGSACLATIGELIHFLNRNTSFLAFVDTFINSFIFSLDWFEKYKSYPFGDREHGHKGLLDYYLTDLNLTVDQYKKMVFMIYERKYRGHSQCFCGSKKKLRDCHGSYVLPIIQNENHRNMFLHEADFILMEDNKNV